MSASPDIRIVLVRPRNSGNVGSAVRALRNFGFAAPRIVDMYAFDAEEARRLAAGCEANVAEIEFFPDLESALADRSFVVGTTSQHRRHWRLEPIDQALPTFNQTQWEKAAILFGNEQSGLSEEEMRVCERLVTIPTVEYTSLNLAQAVLLTAWEIRKTLTQRPLERGPELAPRELTEPMFEQMFEALERISFLHPGQDTRVRAMLRQLFSRNGVTRRDVQVLRGIWHQVLWLAGVKGVNVPAESPEETEKSQQGGQE